MISFDMKKLALASVAAMSITLVGAQSANALGAVDVLVGDKDLYGGLCSAQIGGPGTCTWTGSPYYMTDARDAAEMAATNGAQYTDEYDALGFGPTSATSVAILMPYSGMLRSGTVTIAVADLQSTTFGPLMADINGMPISLFHDDGFTADNVYSFVMSASALAAANTAGEAVLSISRAGSGDYVAFDWFELTGTVPEPSTWAMMLVGFAGLGFAGYRTRRYAAAAAL